jgi:hypothetical protein
MQAFAKIGQQMNTKQRVCVRGESLDKFGRTLKTYDITSHVVWFLQRNLRRHVAESTRIPGKLVSSVTYGQDFADFFRQAEIKEFDADNRISEVDTEEY